MNVLELGTLAATRVDAAVFAVAAAITLAGAIGVVIARNPVHSALMLVMTLFGVAVLFVAQEAHFVAAVQVIVYAGAIVVLFLFVIMLLGVDKEEAVETDELRGQRPFAVVLGLLSLALLFVLGREQWVTGASQASAPVSGAGENIEKIGASLFSDYLLPLQATSILLVIAVVGAVALARRPPREEVEHDG
jgi:NADH-quinone oxidoreductase subunit J